MFFSLPNLSANTVTEMPNPDSYVYPGTLPHAEDKVAYTKWCLEMSTRHSFLSMIEGASPLVRVTDGSNPAMKIHGVHIDYDYTMSPTIMEEIEKDPACEWRPMWVSKSRNGRCRLTWEFELPGNLLNDRHYIRIKRRLMKELRLKAWHRKMDEDAYADSSRYYEHGTDWVRVPNAIKIPAGLVSRWFFEEAMAITMVNKQFNTEIPIVDIAAEVHRKFPGRWKGEFNVGSQGVRFWDPSADNPTGAWIRKEGVYCFTGESRFMHWDELLGKEFVSQYTSHLFDEILEKSAYDGSDYYSPNEHGMWISLKEKDFIRGLKVGGFSAQTPKGATCSEVDRICHAITSTRRVKSAAAFIYHPQGMVRWEGNSYVNTTNVACMKPGAPFTDGRIAWDDAKEFFPMIHSLISELMLDNGRANREQLNSFLAWCRHAYVPALSQTPEQGHAMIIIGKPGTGKTLLIQRIIAPLLGGMADGTQYAVNGDQFNARVAESPLMVIDDSTGCADHMSRTRFTSIIKKHVADPRMVANEKYTKATEVPWLGRIMIAGNDDAESVRILPNLDQTVRDKICMFRTSAEVRVRFESVAKNNARIARELPAFARFLIDWSYPDDFFTEGTRFGFKAYHHPALLEEAHQVGASELIEVLISFFKEYRKMYPKKKCWKGLATTLYGQLKLHNEGVMREIKAKQLAIMLAGMERQAMGVKSLMTRTKTKAWFLTFDLECPASWDEFVSKKAVDEIVKNGVDEDED